MIRALVLIAFLGVMLGAPAASATTVEVGNTGFVSDIFGPSVLITDDAGEVNSLSVSYTRKSASADLVVMVHDGSAPLQPGEGCTATADRVRCEAERLQGVQAVLGAGDDRAVAASPSRGTRSCACVELYGGAGNDKLTSRDGAVLYGDDGADSLVGKRNVARAEPDASREASGELMVGGPGNDKLQGGIGPDFLHGGHSFDDQYSEEPGTAGRDRLDGGRGDDRLEDGDFHFDWEPDGEIGPDTLIGGTGEDTVRSYEGRTTSLAIDLSAPGGDGQQGENDNLVNVEILYGGLGDNRFTGDRDDNAFYSDILFGRPASNVVRGRGGDDFIGIEAYDSGSLSCGPGRDTIFENPRGEAAPHRADAEQDRGPWISASCEALWLTRTGGRAIDPVPDEPPSGRSLTFDLPPRSRLGPSGNVHMKLTGVAPPFEKLASGYSRRAGITVKLPADVAEQARRDGVSLRAEVSDDPSKLKLWRFDLQP